MPPQIDLQHPWWRVRRKARLNDLRIYDLNGHLIHQWNRNTGSVLWNGQDLHGREVASGTYIVRANVGDRVMSKRIVLMR